MPADKFSPNGNPQDRAVIIDPATYLPKDFQPVYGDPEEAHAALDFVTAEIEKARQGGDLNKALDIGLGVIGKLLGTVI